MEVNTLSLPHHGDISTHPQPSDAETRNPTSTQLSQLQTMPVETSYQRMKIHEELSMLKWENTHLIQEKEALIVDLEELKKDVFRRMPPTQISDDTIQKAFEGIRGSIDEFVFDVMRNVADDVLYNLCLTTQQKAKHKRRKFRTPLSRFIQRKDISLWGPYECSNFYILSVILQWSLDEFVFRFQYPIGVTEKQIRVLEEVAEGLRHAKKRDRLDAWRSETLTALTALPENEARLEAASTSICNRLSNILSPWLFEAGPFAHVEERFRLEILDPAIKLHQNLTSSSYHYEARPIEVFDGLSPRQMLDEWELKNADTWQKARGEREVGKALYCLHPSTVRLRAKGTAPIVVARPVVVVKSPERERISNWHALDDSSLSGTMAAPTAIEYNPATDHTTSPLDQEDPAQARFVGPPSTFTDSDSTIDSRSRRLGFYQRRASTHPSTKKHEQSLLSSQRRMSVPVDSFYGEEDPQVHWRSRLEGERQFSGRYREDQDIHTYTRGHAVPGSSYSHRSQGAVRQPSRRPSRDTSDGRSSPRRSAIENSQPPVAPSTLVPSTTLGKSRSFKERFFYAGSRSCG